MQIDKIAFFGDSYCADFEDTFIEQLSKDYEILHLGEPGHACAVTISVYSNAF